MIVLIVVYRFYCILKYVLQIFYFQSSFGYLMKSKNKPTKNPPCVENKKEWLVIKYCLVSVDATRMAFFWQELQEWNKK